MDMSELLPCPFCGGKASRHELEDPDNFGGSVISCDRCGASSPVHFDRKENLISSWNERSAGEQAELEAVFGGVSVGERIVKVSQESRAWLDVLDERGRQVDDEGWTPEHDDKHVCGELALAAAGYAYCAGVEAHDHGEGIPIVRRRSHAGYLSAPPFWPFSARWWKPTDQRSTLIKAGALILAEIERIDRAAEREEG